MLLAEELALVALMPDKGSFRAGSAGNLNACLAGLLVAEALLDGSLQRGEEDDRVIVVHGRPARASPVLAAAVQVAAEKGPKLKAVLSHMSRGLEHRLGQPTRSAVLDGLVRSRVIEPSTGGLQASWALLDHDARTSAIARLQQAAQDDGPIEHRLALLLSMTGPARLLEVVAPERGTRRHARHRIDHALDGSPFAGVGQVVRKLIKDAAAAAMMAAG